MGWHDISREKCEFQGDDTGKRFGNKDAHSSWIMV